MEWSEGMTALSGGAFWLALRVALSGAVLLLVLRPLIVRRWPRLAGKHEEARGATGSVAPAPAAELERAQAAYARHGLDEAESERSSPEAELPINSAGGGNAPACPSDLRRRIDRIEAKVRARSAGSRG